LKLSQITAPAGAAKTMPATITIKVPINNGKYIWFPKSWWTIGRQFQIGKVDHLSLSRNRFGIGPDGKPKT